MRVFSLFDGIAGARQALKNIDINVNKYFASEIDEYAIKIAKANHTDIIQVGDINNLNFNDYKNIDLLVGGSPCQGFSSSGKGLNFNDPRSKLFFKFVEALRIIKPKFFILENVRMEERYRNLISNQLGVEPILINSALVTAQNRKRLYWTNIPGITQPEDQGILLKDILEEKNYIPGRQVSRRINKENKREDYNLSIKRKQYIEINKDVDKMNTLTTVLKDTILIRDKSKTVRSGGRYDYGRHEWDSVDKDHLRKLTPLECERLQGYPDNFTATVSKTQRYKALGNSFTVPVIVHILRGILPS